MCDFLRSPYNYLSLVLRVIEENKKTLNSENCDDYFDICRVSSRNNYKRRIGAINEQCLQSRTSRRSEAGLSSPAQDRREATQTGPHL